MRIKEAFKLVGALSAATAAILLAVSSFRQSRDGYFSPMPGTGLQVGDAAPDFTLQDVNGKSTVKLSHLKGRPVVLLFGSVSCPYFRRGAGALQQVYDTYKDKAHIYVVYTREQHPRGDPMGLVRLTGKAPVAVAQARTLKERRKAAHYFAKLSGTSVPILVDGMNNRIEKLYDGNPVHAYIVDADGKIAYHTEEPQSLATHDVRKLLN